MLCAMVITHIFFAPNWDRPRHQSSTCTLQCGDNVDSPCVGPKDTHYYI